MPLAQSLVTGAIVGSWYASAPGGGTDQIVFTFLANGKFMVSDKGTVANDPNGTSGIEWGNYTWNPATGALTTTFLSNTDGEWGMSHAGALTMTVSGDTLTVGGGEGGMPLTRMVAVPGSIVGSWYAQYPNGGDLENVLMTFLVDGTYLVASEGTPPGPDARDGLEWGHYTWNPSTGAFTYTSEINTDGEWGLSHAGITNIQVAGDVITLASNEGNFNISRVPNGQAAPSGTGTAGPDTLNGTAAADTFTGLGGNDTIEGFTGIDTANYSLARSNYTITKGAGTYTVAANTGTEGTDTLSHVERLHFSDTNVAMDLSGNAGTTAKILAAVFGPSSVSVREYVGIGLSYLDAGVSYADLIQGAMNVALGSSTPSNTAVVNLLYTNIAGTAPSAFDLQMFVGLLDSQVLTQSALAILAADSQVNQANINLTGLTGIEFI